MVENLLNYEWQALSQLIYRMNRRKDYEDFAQTILEQLYTIIPFSHGLVFKASRENGSVRLSSPLSIPSDTKHQFFVDKFIHGNYNPPWVSYLNSPWSSVFRYSNITPNNQWSNSPIYDEILEPQELYYAIYMTFVHRDQPLGAIAIWRKKQDQDFSEKELYMLEMLKIHIELKLYYVLNYDVVPRNQHQPKRSALGEFSEQHNLTKREFEILQLLYEEKDSMEICGLLYISDSTLRKHIHNIYQKLGIKNRVQLIQKIKTLK
ncbi:MAG: helix-turn-helix transcriptional regulator [Clostridium sp.]|nr:helix-turn-helix transcriptional regulator [Clostridium sp.]